MRASLILASIVSFAACGSDEPAAQHGSVNTDGARASVDGVHEVFTAIDAGDGETAANAVMAMTAAGQIIVSPVGPSQKRGLLVRDPARSFASGGANLTGSASCDSTGCTYADFGDDSDFGSYRINGSIRHVGDTLTFDLTYDLTYDDLVFHWSLSGELTVTDTSIDGEIHSAGDADFTDNDTVTHLSWGIDVDYDAIVLDAGCPVGGSLSATVSYAVEGEYGGSYRAEGPVSFGPTCGAYTVH